MKYCVTINNNRYEIEVEKGDAAILSKSAIAVEALENKKTINTKEVAAGIDTVIEAKNVEASKQQVEESYAASKEVIKAPMPGIILDVKTSVGSYVKAGDILLCLEAMKMENEINAHVDGIVAEIKVSRGSSVSAGDVLVVLR